MFQKYKINDINKLIIVLLVTDLGFIFLHILYKIGRLSSPMYAIYEDMGYSEIYMYVKEFWIAGLLFILALTRRKAIYFAWSILFAYFVLDDSLRIHERVGLVLSEKINYPSIMGLSPHDFGELTIVAFFGFFIFTFIGFSFLRSERFERHVSKRLFYLILILVFFGIGLDMLHAAISIGREVVGLLEDGGELIVMSFILAYVYSIPLSDKTTFNL